MDKFDALMAKLNGMKQADSLKYLNSMMKEQCICPGCSIYTECSKDSDETLFCFLGKGKCGYSTEDVECICGDCPLTTDCDLSGSAYCGRGTELEQRKM